MTQTNDRPQSPDDDEMLPEYDFSKLRQVGPRGKYAEAMRQGYSVTVHNADGTSTTQHFSQQTPMSNDKIWYGDRIEGDKVLGDKITGNKVQIGTVHGDAIAGNKIVYSHNLVQAAQDIKVLIAQLSSDYDTATQSGKMGLSSKVLEAVENNPTIKARVVNALKEAGSTALEEAIDHPVAKVLVAGAKGFLDA